MPKNTWREFIENAKTEYRKIGSIKCPAFDGDKVFFTERGFNHLIMKRGVRRSRFQQERRLNRVGQAVELVSKQNNIHSYRISVHEKSVARFWSLEGSLRGRTIIVVIRQINYGNKHFFSVMDKRIHKRTNPRRDLL